MPPTAGQSPVFRFAPSPNGALHLGHAFSAFLNQDMAARKKGRLLLRIEDIDLARCTPALEQAVYEDLSWLGVEWEEPVRRQSEHLGEYQAALDRLDALGLVYPAFMTRGEVQAEVRSFEAAGAVWPRDPDGTALYPSHDRHRPVTERRDLLQSGKRHGWRLDMEKAAELIGQALFWEDTGEEVLGQVPANPMAWGDVVLSRSDAPSSYHLSVVLDDALQGVTHVVRGLDLFHATSVHVLLQKLLGLPTPAYHHHRLITDETGRKLSKSSGDVGLRDLRGKGLSAADIRRLVGL